ncbi:MAG TPA: hypothetical protein VFF52_17405 [Isosphaeraceae bacterium]|nr:hypothetical protein [Isosphaeraceae bacterium]
MVQLPHDRCSRAGVPARRNRSRHSTKWYRYFNSVCSRYRVHAAGRVGTAPVAPLRKS